MQNVDVFQQRLVDQIRSMVAESGTPEGFDAAGWVLTWMATPNPALGGRLPSEFDQNDEGQETLLRLIAQMQCSAYA